MLGIESSTECGPRLDGNGAAAQEAMPAGGNSTRFDSLAAHFGELGISGQGLETAAQGMPLVGPVIGAASTQLSSEYTSHACICSWRWFSCSCQHCWVLWQAPNGEVF